VSAAADEDPVAPDKESARAVFFEGLDLQEAGDIEGAVARYELALADDPELHQARLYLAECFHELGLDGRAREQLEIYLSTPFPGADPARAATLMLECGGDPESVTGSSEDDGGEAEGTLRRTSGERDVSWRALAVEAGASVNHWANEIGLVAAGPSLELRWLPLRYLEVGLGGGVGFGSHPQGSPVIRVPEVAPGVAGSIPVGRIRLVGGVQVPVTFSKLPTGPRADLGVRGRLGVRIAFGKSPLYAAIFAEGGYLVTPTLGGSVRLGAQFGPERK